MTPEQRRIVEEWLDRVDRGELSRAVRALITDLDAARHHGKLHADLSDALKIALRMPGTGNYVEWAKECRAAVDDLVRVTAEREEARTKLMKLREEISRRCL